MLLADFCGLVACGVGNQYIPGTVPSLGDSGLPPPVAGPSVSATSVGATGEIIGQTLLSTSDVDVSNIKVVPGVGQVPLVGSQDSPAPNDPYANKRRSLFSVRDMVGNMISRMTSGNTARHLLQSGVDNNAMSFQDLLTGVVQQLCIHWSGRSCDVDITGDSDWRDNCWSKRLKNGQPYPSLFPPVTETTTTYGAVSVQGMC